MEGQLLESSAGHPDNRWNSQDACYPTNEQSLTKYIQDMNQKHSQDKIMQMSI